MKNCKLLISLSSLLLITLAAGCAPIKTLEVWKEESHTQPLQKVLIIALAQQENIRKQGENVLTNHLTRLGVDAIPSYKVLPHPEEKPDRDTVLAKVRELGIGSVLVARSINKKEITNHQYGGATLGGVAVHTSNGWYGYSYGFSYDREYDTDFFTVSTKIYDVESQKPFWSYLAQVKVEGTREGAVNLLVPAIVEQLELSQLISK